MEESDDAIESGGLADFVPRDGEDVADEHVLEVFGLSGGLAHGEDCGGGGDGVGDSDEGFLWNASFACAGEREDASAEKGEGEAEPIEPPPWRPCQPEWRW